MNIKLSDISAFLVAQEIDFRFIGDPNLEITGFSSLANYTGGTLTWIKDMARFEKDCTGDAEGIVAVVQEGLDINLRNGFFTQQSKRAFFGILDHFFADQSKKPAIGAGAYLSDRVKLGEGVTIGANCVLDGEISIGNGTVLEPGVVILNRVSIGENCYVQSLVSIGIDGYGYTEDETKFKTMVKHYGGVTIGNHVFIGSHTNIARGTIDNTVIGDGVKIAPSSHVGHNNVIHENASIVCSTLYGSVVTGKNAYVSASVVRNQVRLGDDCIVGMGSLVTKDVPEGITVIGSPARPYSRDNK